MTTKQSRTGHQSTSSPVAGSPPRRTKRPAKQGRVEPTQLRLLDGGRTAPRAWQLDARTRRIGQKRVAEAREILRRAQPREAMTPHDQIAG
jgi:hypothetical protein